jgi:hypothetical protein
MVTPCGQSIIAAAVWMVASPSAEERVEFELSHSAQRSGCGL